MKIGECVHIENNGDFTLSIFVNETKDAPKLLCQITKKEKITDLIELGFFVNAQYWFKEQVKSYQYKTKN